MQLDEPQSFDLTAETQEIFNPDGLLAQSLEGFEPRPGQGEMAGAIAEILQEDDPWGHNPIFGKNSIADDTGDIVELFL